MIEFKCQDIKVTFQSWYDAASWFYNQWDNENPLIRHIVDRSSSYFLDFTAWINDTYTAYDILSRCNDDLYADLFEQYLYDLADDLEDDTYDFCVLFTEVEDEKPQPEPNVKYYRITYSCGCGENTDCITADNYDHAIKLAYELAKEDYHMYEGYHGVQTLEDVAIDLFGSDDDLTEDQWQEAEDNYNETIEGTIDYSAEEISFEEYLEERE